MMAMFFGEDAKFSVYEVKNISHLKICSIDFDRQPSSDGDVMIWVVRVVKYPKKVRETVDSRGWIDGEFVDKNDRISCGSSQVCVSKEMDPSRWFTDEEVLVNREEGGVDLDEKISPWEIEVRVTDKIR